MKTKDFESVKFGPHGSGCGVFRKGIDKPITWGIRCHEASRMVKNLQEEKDIQDREYKEEQGDTV